MGIFCIRKYSLSKFHSPMCWNGWDFCISQRGPIYSGFLTLDHMGTPPFPPHFMKLKLLVASKNVNKQDSCFISIDRFKYILYLSFYRESIAERVRRSKTAQTGTRKRKRRISQKSKEHATQNNKQKKWRYSMASNLNPMNSFYEKQSWNKPHFLSF